MSNQEPKWKKARKKTNYDSGGLIGLQGYGIRLNPNRRWGSTVEGKYYSDPEYMVAESIVDL